VSQSNFALDKWATLSRDFASMKMSIQSLAILTFAFSNFALSPKARAVSPPPDGCYPNFTTAEGCDALNALTTGAGNTALGWRSLFLDSTGSFNTALGAGALVLNNGDSNTATGAAALLLNTAGIENTANGTDTLVFNDTGSFNTAVGAFALFSNALGLGNTAVGDGALKFNTLGGGNTAVGFGALSSNTESFDNTAIGSSALESNTTGFNNTAVGSAVLLFNTTGNSNIALGFNAGINITTANNVIAIGSGGADVGDTCFIGNIRDVTTQNGDATAVVIDSAGQLGTMSSSQRFKKEVRPMDKASEAILALKPVTFHYKTDNTKTPQFGLIAEDVAKVNPDLVVRDKNGDIYTVRYDAVNAMLLNEFLKEHRKVEELRSAIAQQRTDFEAAMVQQQKRMEAVVARLTEQEARIQNVSAQIEMRKPPSQTLVQNH
jgi:hypothetical protein